MGVPVDPTPAALSPPEDSLRSAPPAGGAPLAVLLRARARAVLNHLRTVRQESLFKIITVLTLGTGLWVGLFLIFLHSFQFISRTLEFAEYELIRFVFSLFFLTLTVMLVFSNAIISFTALFKSEETAFLMTAPVAHETLFGYKLIESLLFSSWAFLILGLPLMLAYGVSQGVAWTYFPAIAAFFLPFVVVPASLGALVALVLTTFFPRRRLWILGALIAACLAGGALLAVRVLGVGGEAGAAVDELSRIFRKLEFSQNPYLPNTWMTRGLLAAARAQWADSLLYLGMISAAAFFLHSLAHAVASRLYSRGYSRAQAAGSRRFYRGGGLLDALAQRARRWAGPLPLLVAKDVKTFLRDPVQWSQVLIFFGVLTVYILNLRWFPYNFRDPFWKNLISFLNLATTSLTLATLTTRFVFPLLSLEGRQFWILGLLPVARSRIIVGKFVFAFLGSLAITESLTVLSNYMLRTGPATTEDLRLLILQVFTAGLICFGLTGLSVGMGALFPSFRERDPAKIVSGFGGTLTLVLSVGYVVAVVVAEAIPCHLHFAARVIGPEQFQSWITVSIAVVVVLSLLAGLVPMALGARAFERLEF